MVCPDSRFATIMQRVAAITQHAQPNPTDDSPQGSGAMVVLGVGAAPIHLGRRGV